MDYKAKNYRRATSTNEYKSLCYAYNMEEPTEVAAKRGGGGKY